MEDLILSWTGFPPEDMEKYAKSTIVKILFLI